jgi:hypothetical protein
MYSVYLQPLDQNQVTEYMLTSDLDPTAADMPNV